jgi:hypothetical protein
MCSKHCVFAMGQIKVAMGGIWEIRDVALRLPVHQKSKLKGELRMSQPNNRTGAYKCSACGETFESQIELWEHEKDCQQRSDQATAGPKK